MSCRPRRRCLHSFSPRFFPHVPMTSLHCRNLSSYCLGWRKKLILNHLMKLNNSQNFSIIGVTFVVYADKGSLEVGIPRGVIWSLVSSVSYAMYLVLLRRRVESEDKLDIPMFFGIF